MLHSWLSWAVAGLGLAAMHGCAEAQSDDTDVDPGSETEATVGTDDSGATDGDTGDTDGDTPMLAWEPCPLSTHGSGDEADCAVVEVPRDWDDPAGETIELFVKRIAGSGPKTRQVWLLSGGPGQSSAPFEDTVVRPLRELSPASDIYILDHRGVGRSTRLGCPDHEVPGVDAIEPGEWPACIDHLEATWGDGLADFNTTQAARDVGALIAWTRAPDQDVHVYGVSYGSYWAQRYMQLFPEQPTSVTLDSLCQAGLCSLDQFDPWVDRVGRKFMQACAADDFCAGKLGGDPLAAMGAFLDGLDEGACGGLAEAGITRTMAKQLFGAFLAALETRPLIPALVYRGNRCEAGDVAVFHNLLAVLTAAPDLDSAPPDVLLSSQVLGNHIAISEMMSLELPPLAQALETQEQAYFWGGDVASEYALYEQWPRYPRDEYVGEYPSVAFPMLMMNGTLDPQTPIEFADEIAPHYAKPGQTFVAVPDAPHGIVVRTPTVTAPHTPCGLSMFAAFVEDPLAPVDTSCLSDIVPLDFHGDPATAAALLGTTDAWEDGAPSTSPGPILIGDELEVVRRRFQRARQRPPNAP
ncbi:alpha/beta hydrolase fold [Nannocystis exedens]|uniref:Alpha/beta hydrolase fold n=2 Tax=Nannocystis exedens TaxID=54 RepID=A0A1I2FZ69_9BACT|nr:Tripeptidyl aminopeptidase precursor [Nannocystis exedens]SFF10705.1 alpha/beta hydrolase fold [Nannocystis exedens]